MWDRDCALKLFSLILLGTATLEVSTIKKEEEQTFMIHILYTQDHLARGQALAAVTLERPTAYSAIKCTFPLVTRILRPYYFGDTAISSVSAA